MPERDPEEPGHGAMRTIRRALLLLAAALPVSTVLGTYTRPSPDSAGIEWRDVDWLSTRVTASGPAPDRTLEPAPGPPVAADTRSGSTRMVAEEAENSEPADDGGAEQDVRDARVSSERVPFLEELFQGEAEGPGAVRRRRERGRRQIRRPSREGEEKR